MDLTARAQSCAADTSALPHVYASPAWRPDGMSGRVIVVGTRWDQRRVCLGQNRQRSANLVHEFGDCLKTVSLAGRVG
jgi:hypothetical protein